jgi:hypothetical protein
LSGPPDAVGVSDVKERSGAAATIPKAMVGLNVSLEQVASRSVNGFRCGELKNLANDRLSSHFLGSNGSSAVVKVGFTQDLEQIFPMAVDYMQLEAAVATAVSPASAVVEGTEKVNLPLGSLQMDTGLVVGSGCGE